MTKKLSYKERQNAENEWITRVAFKYLAIIVSVVYAMGNLYWFGLILTKIINTAFNSMALFWILIFTFNVWVSIWLVYYIVFMHKVKKPVCLED